MTPLDDALAFNAAGHFVFAQVLSLGEVVSVEISADTGMCYVTRRSTVMDAIFAADEKGIAVERAFPETTCGNALSFYRENRELWLRRMLLYSLSGGAAESEFAGVGRSSPWLLQYDEAVRFVKALKICGDRADALRAWFPHACASCQTMKTTIVAVAERIRSQRQMDHSACVALWEEVSPGAVAS
jgi:hypothetical protein